MRNMTQGTPWKVILRFMIPILAGNFLQLTYSITDTRIVGTFLGDTALAGVGSTTVLQSLFIGFFMGIANGFAIMIAQMFGAEKFDKVRRAFAAALVMGSVIAIVLVSIVVVCLSPILHFLNIPDELFSSSYGYIRIIILGMLITMLYDILLASARAIGDSLTPLMILILSVILNIIGDVLLLGVFRTSVKGAAIATVAAQFIALIICAIYIIKKYTYFRLKKEDFKNIEINMAKNMLYTGLSMGFMSSLVNLGTLVLQTAINALGNSYIVAHTAARKITEALMTIFNAMGQTMATYCGQNYGAGNYSNIKKGLKAALTITSSWCIIVLIIVYLFSSAMVHLITGSNDTVMLNAASKYLKIDCLLYFVVTIIIVVRNSLQGMGNKITPLISSGIEMVCKVVLTCTLVPALGYMGVILVEPISWIAMVGPLVIRLKKNLKEFSTRS